MIIIPLKDTLFEIYESLNWMQGLSSDAYKSVYSKVVLHVEIEEDIPFYANLKQTRALFESLLSHCIRFQDVNKPERHITILGKTEADLLSIHMTHNGVGIPFEARAGAFDDLHKIPLNNSYTFTGLIKAKEAIKQLQGNIEITSGKDNSTNFLISIPNRIPPASK